MFNLGHTISMTLLQLQIDVQKVFTMRQIYMVTHQFLYGRGKIAQPVSTLSYICIVYCIVVHDLKQTCPLKSVILMLACVHQGWVLYRELMFEQVSCLN